MEASNLPTFLKFENAKKVMYLCYICKKSWAATKLEGARAKLGGGLCPSPGPGLKPPLENFDLHP